MQSKLEKKSIKKWEKNGYSYTVSLPAKKIFCGGLIFLFIFLVHVDLHNLYGGISEEQLSTQIFWGIKYISFLKSHWASEKWEKQQIF